MPSLQHVRGVAAVLVVTALVGLAGAAWSATPDASTAPSTRLAAFGVDPGSTLRSRIGPPTALVVETYVKAGAADITSHEFTDKEWALVETALARLPPLHRRILQGHLRRLSFVDGKPGAGSALTSRADAEQKSDVFDITLRASLLQESLTDFLNTKEANLFEADGSGYAVRFEAGTTDALTYILLHEATHVVDQTLGLTASDASPFRVGIWTAPRQLAEPYASSLVSKTWFRRAPKIPIGQAPTYYRALGQTPFVSFYATAAAPEDLAELVAWQQLVTRFGQTLTLEVRDGEGRTAYAYEPLRSARFRGRFPEVEALLAWGG